MDLFSKAFMWMGLICGWSLAHGRGLFVGGVWHVGWA